MSAWHLCEFGQCHRIVVTWCRMAQGVVGQIHEAGHTLSGEREFEVRPQTSDREVEALFCAVVLHRTVVLDAYPHSDRLTS